MDLDQRFSLTFRMADGILHVDQLAWAGVAGKGFVDVGRPFGIDFRFSFQDVDLLYAFWWLKDGNKKIDTKGALSGFAQWVRTPDKLSIKAQLVS